MVFNRHLLLTLMLFGLLWSGAGQAATSKLSSSVTGTWQNAQGETITFKSNGTITYLGKRYYYAVSNGGIIQLERHRSILTIPYQLSGGKLTLTENGKATVYVRKQ